MGFESLWALYPRKIAKKAAQKAYDKTVKTVPAVAIEASLRLMLQTEWRGRRPEYIPHLASWLNRECFEERTEALEDEHPAGRHRCSQCLIEHEWQESGPSYNWVHHWDLACPEAHAEMHAAIFGVKKNSVGHA
jgi:hypothetical protein